MRICPLRFSAAGLALDRHLLASAPAAAAFTVQAAPQTQIARWVQALLSGK